MCLGELTVRSVANQLRASPLFLLAICANTGNNHVNRIEAAAALEGSLHMQRTLNPRANLLTKCLVLLLMVGIYQPALADETLLDDLPWEHLRGCRAFAHVRPADPQFSQLYQFLRVANLQNSVWDERTLQASIPFLQNLPKCDSLTVGYRNPSLASVGIVRSQKPLKLVRPAQPPKTVRFDGNVAYVQRNQVAFAVVAKSTLLFGSSDAVELSFQPQVNDYNALPTIAELGDPCVVMVQSTLMTNRWDPHQWRLSAFKVDGDAIIRTHITQLEPGNKAELHREHFAGFASLLDRNMRVYGFNDSQFEHSFELTGRRFVQTLRVNLNQIPKDQWRNAIGLLEIGVLMPPITPGIANVKDSAKQMLVINAKLAREKDPDAVRKLEEQAIQLCRFCITSPGQIDAIGKLVENAATTRLQTEIIKLLSQCNTSAALHVYDRAIRGGAKPNYDQLTALYFAQYGTPEQIAAACRVIAQTYRTPNSKRLADESLGAVAANDLQAASARAAAAHTLKELGLDPGVAFRADQMLSETPALKIKSPRSDPARVAKVEGAAKAGGRQAEKAREQLEEMSAEVVENGGKVFGGLKTIFDQLGKAAVPDRRKPLERKRMEAPERPVPGVRSQNTRAAVANSEFSKLFARLTAAESKSDVRGAMRDLCKLQLSPSQVKRVVPLLRPYLTDSLSSRYAFELIAQQGFTDDDIPALFELLGNSRLHAQVVTHLNARGDAAIRSHFATRMAKVESITDPAFRIAEGLGSRVEDLLWPTLQNPNVAMQAVTLRALEKIGTAKSIEHINTIDLRLNSISVNRSIAKMQQRASSE